MTNSYQSGGLSALDNDVSRNARAVIRGDGTATFEQGGVVRGSTVDTIQPGSPVFSAIRHGKNHSPQTVHDMTEDSIVTVDGMEMQLRSALAAGIVSRKPDGTYVRGGGGASQGNPTERLQERGEESSEQQGDPKGETMAPAAERQLTQLVEATSPLSQIEALQDISRTGNVSDRVMGNLASQMGVEPHQVAAQLEPIREAFEAQATSAVETLGVPAEDFFAWAYEQRPEAMQKAIYRHGTERTTEGYRQLAQDWLLTADEHSPDMILGAKLGEGVSVSQDHRGKIIVTDREGVSYEWRSAVRNGIIRVRAG